MVFSSGLCNHHNNFMFLFPSKETPYALVIIPPLSLRPSQALGNH